MPTVARFFDDLRSSYLNNPSGGRFGNDLLLPYLQSALAAMYGDQKPAFYGRWLEADVRAFMDKTAAQAAEVELFDVISPQYYPELLNRVWTKASSTEQRGQAEGNPLSRDQEMRDTP